MPDEKLPPNNREAEEAVLGACLINPDAIPGVSAILAAADFHDQTHRELWTAIKAIYDRNEPVDLLTVSDELGRDEIPAMVAMTDRTPTSVHAEHYARMVAADSQRRQFMDASGQIARAAYGGSLSPAEVEELALKLVLGIRKDGNAGTQSLSRLVREYYDRLEALARTDKVLGLPTGFHDLDKILGGLQRSDLVLLAARPRIGKTSLALCIARNAVTRENARVLFFSLEMSADQVVRRLTALESDVPIVSLKTGKLIEAEWPAFIKAADSMDRMTLWIDDAPGITPAHIRAEALKLEAMVGPLDLIIVDYLQLMRPDRKQASRYEAVTEIGQALKSLAKDLRVPVLALSQLNRACESRADKRPQLHDLRESGDLEQSANVVMLLFRAEVYGDSNATPGLADVIVAKNRDGGEGTAQLYFHGPLARFSNVMISRKVL